MAGPLITMTGVSLMLFSTLGNTSFAQLFLMMMGILVLIVGLVGTVFGLIEEI
jgi:hypothetical protein